MVKYQKKKKKSELLENKWGIQYLYYNINPRNNHTMNTECNIYCTWQEIMPNQESFAEPHRHVNPYMIWLEQQMWLNKPHDAYDGVKGNRSQALSVLNKFHQYMSLKTSFTNLL